MQLSNRFFAVLALAIAINTAMPALAVDYPCATGGFLPVNDGSKLTRDQALVMLLIPFGAALVRDRLANVPKVKVQFRVRDAAGKPVANARIAANQALKERVGAAANAAMQSYKLAHP